MSICFPLCPRIRTLLDGSWHFAFVPEADMGLVPAAILLLVHIDQGAGLLSEQFTFRTVICTGGSSRHWISTFAALITARHRSTSSCMYLDVFAIEPPKISADSFLR